MKIASTSALSTARRRPLAAAAASLFALAAPAAFASTWQVGNCNDAGPGSLRAVVAAAATLSGDTVDMSGLKCSAISLLTGAILVNQSSLTLQGPGAGALNVYNQHAKYSGGKIDRVINHQNTGTLTISGLTIAAGVFIGTNSTTASRPALGGCIYSQGNVTLSHSVVTACEAGYDYHYAYSNGNGSGGGIFALGNLFVSYSTIANNLVYAKGVPNGSGGYSSAGYARGGGAFAGKNFITKYSTISDNSARVYKGFGPANPYHSLGGGVYASRNASIYESTISGNAAGQGGGLLVTSALPTQATMSITNSTISGNQAYKAAALYANVPATIGNSTIAFNQISKSGHSPYAGVVFSARNGSFGVNLQSALFSNNTTYHVSSSDDDIAVIHNGAATVTITGANNLVYRGGPGVDSFPGDTLIGKCPLLKPLKDNGGATQTHDLYSGSPAVDAGNNATNLNYDQRGGPTPPPIAQPPLGYPRVSGIAADIGAYEVQQTDAIFNAGFEGCP